LPVGVTWFAISLVSSGFDRYIKLHPTTSINLISYWNGSFGTLSPMLRLSTIAAFDVLVILTVIFLSITYTSKERNYLNSVEKRTNSEDLKRIALVIDIKKFLFPHKQITPIVINESIRTSLRIMGESNKALLQTSKSLGRSISEITKREARVNRQQEVLRKLLSPRPKKK